MGPDPADQPRPAGRRRRSDDLEEGEFDAGDDGDQEARPGPEIKVCRLQDIVDGDALPSPMPSCDSDRTVSDLDADAGLAGFPCPVCRREFASGKAVHGHMRVHHQPQGGRQGIFVGGGWAVTGRLGFVGGRSVSPEEGVGDSTSMGALVPVLDPAPVAFASRTSSAEPKPNPPPPGDESMAIVVAADNNNNNPPNHPSCSPQCDVAHQPAAPHAVVAQPQPAAAALPQIVVSPPRAIARHVQRAAPSPTARDEQGRWVCKEEGCNHRFDTHQGLGGHMAGHKNRQTAAAAAAGLAQGGDAASNKPAKLHPCKHCPRVFESGVKLGGHMRMHYDGKVIIKKRRADTNNKPPVSARELAVALFSMQASTQTGVSPPDELALSLSPPAHPPEELALSLSLSPPAQIAPAATDVARPTSGTIIPTLAGGPEPEPAPAPVSPGVMRIFGVNIVAAPPAAEEVSSAVTEADQSSAASSNIQE